MVMAVVRFLLAVSSCLMSLVISFTYNIYKSNIRKHLFGPQITRLIFTIVSLSPALFLISRIWLRRDILHQKTKTNTQSPEKLNNSSLCLLQSTCSVSTNSCLCSHHISHLILNRRHLFNSHIKTDKFNSDPTWHVSSAIVSSRPARDCSVGKSWFMCCTTSRSG